MSLAYSDSLNRLLEIEDELHYIPLATLNSDQKAQRAQALGDVGDNIQTLIDKRLEELLPAGLETLAKLDQATAKLKQDLKSIQTAIQMLNVISGALNAITSLVKLL